MRYPLGQPINLSVTLTNLAGVLTDDATLGLTVQNPDLTQQVFSSPTHDSTGQYHQLIPSSDLTQQGHYQYVWQSTSTAAGVTRGDFDVFDPFEPEILSLEDAKAACNIQNTTVYDSELQSYIDAITADFATLTGGPAYNQTISERCRVSGDLRKITLRQRPLVSVTSITDIATGVAMPLNDLDPDLNSGILERKLEWPFWSRGIFYQIVYVAGWGTAIPAAFNSAARIYIQQIWNSQRGPGMAPVPGIEGIYLSGSGFYIPALALALMKPYTQEVYV